MLEPKDTQRLWQAELTFIPNCWYQEFELLISTMQIVDINNVLLP